MTEFYIYFILLFVGCQHFVGKVCKIFLMKNNEFGQILKELRTERGLSQRELGEAIGFCNQTVSFWESGQREPDLDTLLILGKFFDVSVDYLLGNEKYD